MPTVERNLHIQYSGEKLTYTMSHVCPGTALRRIKKTKRYSGEKLTYTMPKGQVACENKK
jgi:hypothetical protein